jgi:hypothetical protein
MFSDCMAGLRRAIAAFLSALLVAGCGGVDSGGTGSFTSGPITGFGSIIVGGVRFDDAAASVQDEDGAPRTRDDLRLGMMTEVSGTAIVGSADGPVATASSIRYASEIVGPVNAVNVNDGTFTALGHLVRVTSTTVFDATLPGGLSSLTVGDAVEVYGHLDPERNRYVATRVERRSSASLYKIRGPIAALDTVARTLTIDGLTISTVQLSPAELLNARVGQFARVKLLTTISGGVWTAAALSPGIAAIPDRDNVQIEGRITTLVSTRNFNVNGIPIDASAATFPQGEAGIVRGANVKVEGRWSEGALRASRVSVAANQEAGDFAFELHGLISLLDTTAQTFVLRGVTVSYAGNVQYMFGTAADLANGRRVSVFGLLTGDGTRLDVRLIRFAPP